MNYFFTATLQLLLPFALLCGLLWGKRLWGKQTPPSAKKLFWLSLTALCFGFAFWQVTNTTQTIKLILSLAYLAILIVTLLAAFVNRRSGCYLSHFLLLFFAGIFWAQNPNLSAITSTDVINTDFILNLFAISGALLLCLFTAAWLSILLQRQSANYLRPTALILIVGWLLLPLSGQILLSMIKLQWLDLDKNLLSFVAKSLNWAIGNNYFAAGLLALIALLFCFHALLPQKRALKTQHELIARRQHTALYRQARRIVLSGLAFALIIAAAQLYWDKIASQPPRLSEAQPVTLSQDNLVHIDINRISDGKLHRFVWIADDGKAVRFFIINRLADRVSLAVVFDACLLCGDQGYVMQGNQVICIACGVHMFIPSIGKPGGCNPVPINDWQQTDTQVIISKQSLEEGLNYFSTIIKLEVIDPVDGTKLSNTEAKFKYSYSGKTYFFASEQNLNRFRDQPQQFLTQGEQ